MKAQEHMDAPIGGYGIPVEELITHRPNVSPPG